MKLLTNNKCRILFYNTTEQKKRENLTFSEKNLKSVPGPYNTKWLLLEFKT